MERKYIEIKYLIFLQLKARPEVYVPPEAKQPLTPPAPDSAPSNNQAPESQKILLQQNLQGKPTYKPILTVSITLFVFLIGGRE